MASTSRFPGEEEFSVCDRQKHLIVDITARVLTRTKEGISTYNNRLEEPKTSTIDKQRRTHGERIVQPIPGKAVSVRIKLLEPLNGHTMNDCQIAEDQLNELRLCGAVTVYKRAHSLGVLGPTIAHDEYLGHVFWGRIRRIRRVHTVVPRRGVFRNWS